MRSARLWRVVTSIFNLNHNRDSRKWKHFLVLHDEALYNSFSVFPLLLWYYLNFSLAFPLPTRQHPSLDLKRFCTCVLSSSKGPVKSGAEPARCHSCSLRLSCQLMGSVKPGHVRLSVNVNNKLGAKVMTLEQFATIDLVNIGICLTESTWTVNLYLVNLKIYIQSYSSIYFYIITCRSHTPTQTSLSTANSSA